MERSRLHKVNTMTQHGFKAELELTKPDEPYGRVELHQDVDIAVGRCLVAHYRPEQRERLHTKVLA